MNTINQNNPFFDFTTVKHICHLIKKRIFCFIFFSLKDETKYNKFWKWNTLFTTRICYIIWKSANSRRKLINNKDQLYQINEEVIDLLSLVNAYLIRFNKFMDVVNNKNLFN